MENGGGGGEKGWSTGLTGSGPHADLVLVLLEAFHHPLLSSGLKLTVMLKGAICLEMEAINDRAPAVQSQGLHTSAPVLSRFGKILAVLVFP